MEEHPEAGRTDVVKYLVIIERMESGFSAYCPDLEGCVATGASREQIEERMREALAVHVEGLREYGFEVPAPHTDSTYLDIPA